MTELKDLERDLDRFNTRLLVAALFVLLCFGLLGWRLEPVSGPARRPLRTQHRTDRRVGG